MKIKPCSFLHSQTINPWYPTQCFYISASSSPAASESCSCWWPTRMSIISTKFWCLGLWRRWTFFLMRTHDFLRYHASTFTFRMSIGDPIKVANFFNLLQAGWMSVPKDRNKIPMGDTIICRESLETGAATCRVQHEIDWTFSYWTMFPFLRIFVVNTWQKK